MSLDPRVAKLVEVHGRIVAGALAQWAQVRRRDGLPVPAVVAELIVVLDRSLPGGSEPERPPEVQTPQCWVPSAAVAGRVGVSAGAVARRARALFVGGRARRAANQWTWELEEAAVQEWERERQARGAA